MACYGSVAVMTDGGAMRRTRTRGGGQSRRCGIWAVAPLLLGGCIANAPVSTPGALPTAFEHGGASTEGGLPAADWYRQFGSAELDQLISAAQGANTDLEAARARVLQADARARQAGAAILPAVNANGSANYLAGHSSQGSGHELDWAAMLSASYEVDFWGKNRSAAQAARFEARASRADEETVKLTLLSAVSTQYFEVLALRERIAIGKQSVATAERVLQAVEFRHRAGTASPTDVATQTAALDSARLQLGELEQAEVQSRAALALLLGRPPEAFDVVAQSLDALQEPAVTPGLPSTLLTRRPDLVQAESQLRAANANVAVARAALLPSLSLTASGGIQNPALPATVTTIAGTGPSFGLTANLIQPIFDRGRLRAQRDEALARERELLAAYRGTILAALVDVETALSTLEHLDRARPIQEDNVVQSERSLEGAQLRFDRGSGELLALLEAQRTLYVARDQQALYRLARLRARIALCKALGGGWQADAS